MAGANVPADSHLMFRATAKDDHFIAREIFSRNQRQLHYLDSTWAVHRADDSRIPLQPDGQDSLPCMGGVENQKELRCLQAGALTVRRPPRYGHPAQSLGVLISSATRNVSPG
jgi:hypothetical protein